MEAKDGEGEEEEMDEGEDSRAEAVRGGEEEEEGPPDNR